MAESRPSMRSVRDHHGRRLGPDARVPSRFDPIGDVTAPLPRATHGWFLGLVAALVFWVLLGLVLVLVLR